MIDAVEITQHSISGQDTDLLSPVSSSYLLNVSPDESATLFIYGRDLPNGDRKMNQRIQVVKSGESCSSSNTAGFIKPTFANATSAEFDIPASAFPTHDTAAHMKYDICHRQNSTGLWTKIGVAGNDVEVAVARSSVHADSVTGKKWNDASLQFTVSASVHDFKLVKSGYPCKVDQDTAKISTCTGPPGTTASCSTSLTKSDTGTSYTMCAQVTSTSDWF